MKFVLLVLIYGWGNHVTMDTLKVESFEECHRFGVQWVEHWRAKHPDASPPTARYECVGIK